MAKIIQLKRALKNNVSSPVILYDGVCNFCNAIVNFVIRRDKNKVFLFAPVQSREARLLLRSHNESFASLKTVYLVDKGKVLKRSEAVFRIFQYLPYPWKIISAFGILPLGFTDSGYNFIARNRYRWFGKTDEPVKPDEKVKERFLTG
jgi:predicted DCC family thiol-disulfide oxidoreductase YuxK